MFAEITIVREQDGRMSRHMLNICQTVRATFFSARCAMRGSLTAFIRIRSACVFRGICAKFIDYSTIDAEIDTQQNIKYLTHNFN